MSRALPDLADAFWRFGLRLPVERCVYCGAHCHHGVCAEHVDLLLVDPHYEGPA